jgi:branched-chain amino acid aminotransferase
MSEIAALAAEGKILEAFGVGTAVIVAPVGRIGWRGAGHRARTGPDRESVLGDADGGAGGERDFEGWSVPCAGGA